MKEMKFLHGYDKISFSLAPASTRSIPQSLSPKAPLSALL